MSSSKFIFLKNAFKVNVQYLFNVGILLNTIFHFNLNFKLKIDPKTCTFESFEKICQKQVATLYIVIYIIWLMENFCNNLNKLVFFVLYNLCFFNNPCLKSCIINWESLPVKVLNLSVITKNRSYKTLNSKWYTLISVYYFFFYL